MTSSNSGATDGPGVEVIVLGSGGHSAVLISALHHLGIEILGVTSRETSRGAEILGIRIIGDDEEIFGKSALATVLVNGIGMPTAGLSRRHMCAERMRNKGYSFLTVLDSQAVIAQGVDLAEGVQVLCGAVIQPRTKIGRDSIVNTGATIDHDCEIGENCHIAPGATLAGNVKVGKGTLIGVGTTVIPGVVIGEDSLIAAGSVVHHDILPGTHFIQNR